MLKIMMQRDTSGQGEGPRRLWSHWLVVAVAVAARELHQAKPVAQRVEAQRFRIDGHHRPLVLH